MLFPCLFFNLPFTYNLGVSTFVGIVVTVFSTSKIFIIFFKLMVGIVVLGLLHGLLFLPIFLTSEYVCEVVSVQLENRNVIFCVN